MLKRWTHNPRQKGECWLSQQILNGAARSFKKKPQVKGDGSSETHS